MDKIRYTVDTDMDHLKVSSRRTDYCDYLERMVDIYRHEIRLLRKQVKIEQDRSQEMCTEGFCCGIGRIAKYKWAKFMIRFSRNT